jgi:biotin operon repressor
MATIEAQTQKFEALRKTLSNDALRKARLGERLNASTEAMRKVVNEIREAGYDPKTLSATLQEKNQQVETELASFEARVLEQSRALTAIEQSL